MTLEQQVCTVEQAKLLTELGIVCEAYFNWTHYPETKYRKGSIMLTNPGSRESITDMGETYPAFTVAELGVMLPCRIWVCNDMYNLELQKVDENWHPTKNERENEFWYSYQFINREDKIEFLNDSGRVIEKTEAQARAAMLIYLLENKLITPEECNQRLSK